MKYLSWVEAIPSEVHTRWFNFRMKLPHLNKLKIPRLIFCRSMVKRDIHSFCDSSSEAYECCIYVRSISSEGNIPPLKLELCGALLSAQLMQKVMFEIRNCFTKVGIDWYFIPVYSTHMGGIWKEASNRLRII